MEIHLNQINLAGLDSTSIAAYQKTSKVKKMIEDIKRGDVMPPLEMYSPIGGKYTIADGIHRFCSFHFLNIHKFKIKIKA